MHQYEFDLISPPAKLPMKLAIARDALVAAQRASMPGSAQWRAVQEAIEGIDGLMPRVSTGETLSGLLNLTSDSASALKGHSSGRREGVLRGWQAEARYVKTKSIEEIATDVRRKDRIGKYDVQALRESFKDGLRSRAHADLLIELDREVATVHFSWPAFFVSAVTEFVVWNSGEPGYIDGEKSKWLHDALGAQGATDRASRLLVAVAKEANCFDEAFFLASMPVQRQWEAESLGSSA